MLHMPKHTATARWICRSRAHWSGPGCLGRLIDGNGPVAEPLRRLLEPGQGGDGRVPANRCGVGGEIDTGLDDPRLALQDRRHRGGPATALHAFYDEGGLLRVRSASGRHGWCGHGSGASNSARRESAVQVPGSRNCSR